MFCPTMDDSRRACPSTLPTKRMGLTCGNHRHSLQRPPLCQRLHREAGEGKEHVLLKGVEHRIHSMVKRFEVAVVMMPTVVSSMTTCSF